MLSLAMASPHIPNILMSAKNEITIYDIAGALSLSPSTVSRALTSTGSVHKKTREKVIAKARDLGYRQNIFASNLRTQRTRLLGVVVPNINDTSIGNAVAQVEVNARRAGYDVIISQSLNDPEIHFSTIDRLCTKRVDGLIVFPADFITPVGQVAVTELKIPTVFLEAWFPFARHGKRHLDLHTAAYQLTTHLFEKGCKRVGYITTKPKDAASKEIYEGYRKALEDRECSDDLAAGGGPYFEQAARKCVDLLTAPVAADAIIFVDDILTAFSIPSLKESHSYLHGKKLNISAYPCSGKYELLAKERNDAEAGKIVMNVLMQLMRHDQTSL
jgi:LacI family transcriptional regulator